MKYHSLSIECVAQYLNFDLICLGPPSFSVSFLSSVNVMRCSVCHQDYKQSDIIDNYFVKDTTEATSTSDEKAAQVCQNGWLCVYV